jgi:hypothetical protein
MPADLINLGLISIPRAARSRVSRNSAGMSGSLMPAGGEVRVTFRDFGHSAGPEIRGEKGGSPGGRDRD